MEGFIYLSLPDFLSLFPPWVPFRQHQSKALKLWWRLVLKVLINMSGWTNTWSGKYICWQLMANGQHDTRQRPSLIAQSCHLTLSIFLVLCDGVCVFFRTLIYTINSSICWGTCLISATCAFPGVSLSNKHSYLSWMYSKCEASGQSIRACLWDVFPQLRKGMRVYIAPTTHFQQFFRERSKGVRQPFVSLCFFKSNHARGPLRLHLL